MNWRTKCSHSFLSICPYFLDPSSPLIYSVSAECFLHVFMSLLCFSGWLTSSEVGSADIRSTGRSLEENRRSPKRPKSLRFSLTPSASLLLILSCSFTYLLYKRGSLQFMLIVSLSLCLTESSAEEDKLLQISSDPDSPLLRKVQLTATTTQYTHSLWLFIMMLFNSSYNELSFSPRVKRNANWNLKRHQHVSVSWMFWIFSSADDTLTLEGFKHSGVILHCSFGTL